MKNALITDHMKLYRAYCQMLQHMENFNGNIETAMKLVGAVNQFNVVFSEEYLALPPPKKRDASP